MGLSLGNFLWSIVLLLNSVAILNEERFLVRSTFFVYDMEIPNQCSWLESSI